MLEVNHVDEGRPTAFWYAEVEYPTVAAANAWQPAAWGLAAYLNDEVTDQPGQSMGAYWLQTQRLTAYITREKGSDRYEKGKIETGAPI